MDKKQQIIDLWRTSFNDSDEFIKLFFDRVYNKDNVLTIEKDGKIISALQVLPYTMTYYGTEISVAYIYAACTLPSERGKGLMRQLLQNAFEVMKYRKYALTAIIPADPWLFDYYREAGYTEAFDYSEETYIRPEKPVWEPYLTVVTPEVPSVDSLYEFFNRKLRERTCCMLHTYDDFITILRDIQLSGGQVLTALNDEEKPVGMAFIRPLDKDKPILQENKSIYITELLYDDAHVQKLLLQEATLQNNVSKAIYRTPFLGPGTYPLGMACVLDRDRLIHHWASTHENSVLDIGELKKMDTQSLTRILLDYQSREAYMSLMLD
ncbi:GNAT family N-acetyltransferase [Parabacteroides sp. AM08-6]|uniref:GNAT family N-acetyltransferase n=1 Tax=Parabacteroides sp. AM08-6 TaxID=2292053 RepID=UPI000EFEAA11|nr:GNAT family N-acetyltransferase [Parabacteroides sp. AM08-6]RHJ81870.1 GNAT family N-acetyltransferase [Parabacteroides sp. AM08-6]